MIELNLRFLLRKNASMMIFSAFLWATECNEIQRAFTPYVISKGDFFLVLKKHLCEDSVSLWDTNWGNDGVFKVIKISPPRLCVPRTDWYLKNIYAKIRSVIKGIGFIGEASKELILIGKDEGYGYIDQNGKLFISPKYWIAEKFSERLALSKG